MGDVKVVLNDRGVRDLLTSDGVKRDLLRRGERIATAAGPDHEAEVTVGRKRARVGIRTTTPAAMEAEASRGSLSSALDAGR